MTGLDNYAYSAYVLAECDSKDHAEKVKAAMEEAANKANASIIESDIEIV
jgi:hypothetical protein